MKNWVSFFIWCWKKKKKYKPMVNMKFLQRVIFIKTNWLSFLDNIHCCYNNPAVKPDEEVNENQNADDNVRLLSFPKFLHIPRGSFIKEDINHIRVLHTLFVANIHQQMHVSRFFLKNQTVLRKKNLPILSNRLINSSKYFLTVFVHKNKK